MVEIKKRAARSESTTGLLQVLEEMDRKGQKQKDLRGDVIGPFFSRAVYNCEIRIGLPRRTRAKN
ncbi:MAG: hypothetical protein HPY61_12150 [Methanotrichaceae archaeon]|nr:hypothetical protein [Methanotrichaceae archaeon]